MRVLASARPEVQAPSTPAPPSASPQTPSPTRRPTSSGPAPIPAPTATPMHRRAAPMHGASGAPRCDATSAGGQATGPRPLAAGLAPRRQGTPGAFDSRARWHGRPSEPAPARAGARAWASSRTIQDSGPCVGHASSQTGAVCASATSASAVTPIKVQPGNMVSARACCAQSALCGCSSGAACGGGMATTTSLKPSAAMAPALSTRQPAGPRRRASTVQPDFTGKPADNPRHKDGMSGTGTHSAGPPRGA